MKWLKRRSLPRWAKIIRNLLLAAMSLLLMYIFLGAPALSATQAFRRVERQNLVGPSEVLAIVDISDDYFESLIIADDGEGYIMFPVYEDISRGARLYYQEKMGSVTVMAAPISRWSVDIETLTVVLFDNNPDAESAELTLSLSAEVNEVAFANDYTLTALREHDGLFCFELRHTAGDGYYEAESYAFSQLSEITDYFSNPKISIPVNVKLFDSSGSLVYEQNMVLTGEL